MAPRIEDIIRELREGTTKPQDILYFDSRTILKYFEEQDRIGFMYSEELRTRRVDEELYCYTDVDKCYWIKRSNTRPMVLLYARVSGERARYVRGKIMEIRHMGGKDALREFIDLALFILKNRE
jgi:hypothetical protein